MTQRHRVRPDQIYRACRPGTSTRFRVLLVPRCGGRVLLADVATGHHRWVLPGNLHATGTDPRVRARTTGYALIVPGLLARTPGNR
ncbi:hypothetical protein [Streptomyces specialis]|uniref:hypothetical protein n=1 Tax=Streptomyces specialis TaxID=498367 RepID=UPI00131E402B|nr:hypothetical protein [Streptomyces specialis]